jgi:hypothetical protein
LPMRRLSFGVQAQLTEGAGFNAQEDDFAPQRRNRPRDCNQTRMAVE